MYVKRIMCLIFGFVRPNVIILIGAVFLPYLSRTLWIVSFFMNGESFDSTMFLDGLDNGSTGTNVSLIVIVI